MTSGRFDPPSGLAALPDIQQLIQFTPGRNMSYTDLLAFIRSLQTRIEQVAAENEGYRSEVATLKAEGMAKVRRGKKKAVVGAPPSDVDDGNLLRLGKEFAILHDIWIDKLGRSLSHLPTLGDDSSDGSPSADRYSTFEAYKNGLASELVQFLPAKYGIVVLGHCSSQDVFFKGASEIRTHLVRVVRNTAARIFIEYDIPQELWLRDNGAKRAASALFQAFLMFPGTVKQPMFPPVLFFNIAKRDIAMIFLNPIILRIMRVVLFGPSSLDSPNATTASIGKLWNIIEPSSGLIAFCAVLAVYMCSSDQYFSETGANSRTDYYKLFYEYKKLLSVEPKTPQLQRLYDQISQYVFKGISGSASQDAEDFGSLTDPEDEANEIAGVLHSLTGLGHPHTPTPTPAVSEDEPGFDTHHDGAPSESESDTDTDTASSTASNNEEDVPLSAAYVGFNGVSEDEDEDDTDAAEDETDTAEVAVYQTQVALAQPATATHSAHIMSRTIPIATQNSFANYEPAPFVAQQSPFANELGPIPGPSHLPSANLVHFLQSASTGNRSSSRQSPPPLLPAFEAAPRSAKGKGRARGKKAAAPAPNTAVDEGTVRRVSKRNKGPRA